MKEKRNTMALPDLYQACTEEEREMIWRQMFERIGKTRQFVWMSLTGKTQPESLLERKEIAAIIKEVTGIEADPATLFPAR